MVSLLFKYARLLVPIALLTSCVQSQVSPIPEDAGIEHICIKTNYSLDQSGILLESLQHHLADAGYTSETYDRERPFHCKNILTYQGKQRGRRNPHLTQLDFIVYQEDERIAFARWEQDDLMALSQAPFLIQDAPAVLAPTIQALLNNLPQEAEAAEETQEAQPEAEPPEAKSPPAEANSKKAMTPE